MQVFCRSSLITPLVQMILKTISFLFFLWILDKKKQKKNNNKKQQQQKAGGSFSAVACGSSASSVGQGPTGLVCFVIQDR